MSSPGDPLTTKLIPPSGAASSVGS
eukprot:COSAG02_NODE_46245_length_350_cov_1.031873_1_plen_24_part_01